ncbi:hypothetical protein C2G38_2043553 [Gigaspora rosea]|uniref:Uncharacterized protein n=1 Tax=Gigaspora rosea TaxID=44941 RepID=A0A397UMJ8_9GLOM|nr:hypothetical protein C2G38_2043553 [Gigaspora rosea]
MNSNNNNVKKKEISKENSNYPKSKIIIYKTPKRSYKYNIIEPENNENNISIYINNSNIVSDTETLSEIGALRSIKDILAYLIPTIVAKKILDPSDPTINIRISGIEKYSILQIAMKSLIDELEDKNRFIDKEGHYWNVKLYFSADWKFIAICLGDKAANSAEYCLWCPIHKLQNGVLEVNGIRQDNWTITKNMNEINRNYQNIPGHNQPPQ